MLERRVPLRGRFSELALRVGELRIGLGARHRGPCVVDDEARVGRLQSNEHGTRLNKRADIGRRTNRTARGSVQGAVV